MLWSQHREEKELLSKTIFNYSHVLSQRQKNEEGNIEGEADRGVKVEEDDHAQHEDDHEDNHADGHADGHEDEHGDNNSSPTEKTSLLGFALMALIALIV